MQSASIVANSSGEPINDATCTASFMARIGPQQHLPIHFARAGCEPETGIKVPPKTTIIYSGTAHEIRYLARYNQESKNWDPDDEGMRYLEYLNRNNRPFS